MIGSRALWKTASLASIFLTYADPEAIGLSAIGGLLQPVSRLSPEGLAVELAAPSAGGEAELSQASQAAVRLLAPIAPGMLREVAIARWGPLWAHVPQQVTLGAGVVALDGEREMTFDHGDQVQVALLTEAFYTVDVARCLRRAAERGLLRR